MTTSALRYGPAVFESWHTAIEGDGEIAKRCSEYSGINISIHQVRRMRRRRFDPLPAESLGRRDRPLWAIRDLRKFKDWLKREFGE